MCTFGQFLTDHPGFVLGCFFTFIVCVGMTYDFIDRVRKD